MTGLAALCLAGALGVALSLLLIARAIGWRRRRIGTLVRPWLLAILILLTIGLAAEARTGIAALSSTGWIIVSGWLAVSLMAHMVGQGVRTDMARLWGGRLAHAGVAIALGGVLLSTSFASTAQLALAPGETRRFNAWTVQLHEVWPAAGADWVGVAAELRASSGDGVIILEPERRSLFAGSTRALPATIGSGTGVLTASLGSRNADGRWPISLGWTPFLILTQFGLLIAALGCVMAMVGPSIMRWRRLRRARLATAWWA